MSSPNVDGDAGQSILAGTMRQRARRGRGRRVHDDPPCMRNYILLYCALLGGARGRAVGAVGGGRSFVGTTRSTDDDGWAGCHQGSAVRTGGFRVLFFQVLGRFGRGIRVFLFLRDRHPRPAVRARENTPLNPQSRKCNEAAARRSLARPMARPQAGRISRR